MEQNSLLDWKMQSYCNMPRSYHAIHPDFSLGASMYSLNILLIHDMTIMSRIEFLPLDYLFTALSLMRIYEPIIKLSIILYTLVHEIQWLDFINIVCHQAPMPEYHYVYFNQIFIDPYPYQAKPPKILSDFNHSIPALR